MMGTKPLRVFMVWNWLNRNANLFTFFSLFCPDLAVDGLSDLAFSGFLAPFAAVLLELSVNHQDVCISTR